MLYKKNNNILVSIGLFLVFQLSGAASSSSIKLYAGNTLKNEKPSFAGNFDEQQLIKHSGTIAWILKQGLHTLDNSSGKKIITCETISAHICQNLFKLTNKTPSERLDRLAKQDRINSNTSVASLFLAARYFDVAPVLHSTALFLHQKYDPHTIEKKFIDSDIHPCEARNICTQIKQLAHSADTPWKVDTQSICAQSPDGTPATICNIILNNTITKKTVRFPAHLLLASKTFCNLLLDTTGSTQTKSLELSDAASLSELMPIMISHEKGKHIELLIQALKLVSNQEKLQAFVDQLTIEDALWLFKKSDYLEADTIIQACINYALDNPEIHERLPNELRALLTYDHAELMSKLIHSDLIKKSGLFCAIPILPNDEKGFNSVAVHGIKYESENKKIAVLKDYVSEVYSIGLMKNDDPKNIDAITAVPKECWEERHDPLRVNQQRQVARTNSGHIFICTKKHIILYDEKERTIQEIPLCDTYIHDKNWSIEAANYDSKTDHAYLSITDPKKKYYRLYCCNLSGPKKKFQPIIAETDKFVHQRESLQTKCFRVIKKNNLDMTILSKIIRNQQPFFATKREARQVLYNTPRSSAGDYWHGYKHLDCHGRYLSILHRRNRGELLYHIRKASKKAQENGLSFYSHHKYDRSILYVFDNTSCLAYINNTSKKIENNAFMKLVRFELYELYIAGLKSLPLRDKQRIMQFPIWPISPNETKQQRQRREEQDAAYKLEREREDATYMFMPVEQFLDTIRARGAPREYPKSRPFRAIEKRVITYARSILCEISKKSLSCTRENIEKQISKKYGGENFKRAHGFCANSIIIRTNDRSYSIPSAFLYLCSEKFRTEHAMLLKKALKSWDQGLYIQNRQCMRTKVV